MSERIELVTFWSRPWCMLDCWYP